MGNSSSSSSNSDDSEVPTNAQSNVLDAVRLTHGIQEIESESFYSPLVSVESPLRYDPDATGNNFHDEDKYRYAETLDDTAIRLIAFGDDTGLLSPDTLQVRLVQFPLDALKQSGHRWIAMSYAWDLPEELQAGATPAKRYLRVAPYPKTWFPIRKNLFDGLVNLWKHRNKSAFVWADAVCINQEDSQEKNDQLRLMATIYKTASIVYVWLGGCSIDDSQRVESALDGLGEFINTLTPEKLLRIRQQIYQTGRRNLGNQNPSEYLSILGLDMDLETWHILARFFNLRLFWRLWCVQEIVLSLPHVWVMYGSSTLPWNKLFNISKLLSESGLTVVLASLLINAASSKTDVEIDGKVIAVGSAPEVLTDLTAKVLSSDSSSQDSFITTITGSDKEDGSRAFLECFIATCKFRTTYPADRIFAILAMAEQYCLNRGITPLDLNLDIKEDVQITYTKVAKAIIETTRCHGLLNLCQHPYGGEVTILPSWVPNFNTVKFASLLAEEFKPGEQQCDPARISDAIALQIMSISGNNELQLLAMRLDEVVAHAPLDIEYQIKDLITNALVEAQVWQDDSTWYRVLNELPDFYFNGQSKTESFWRTLVCDRLVGEFPAPEVVERDYLNWTHTAWVLKLAKIHTGKDWKETLLKNLPAETVWKTQPPISLLQETLTKRECMVLLQNLREIQDPQNDRFHLAVRLGPIINEILRIVSEDDLDEPVLELRYLFDWYQSPWAVRARDLLTGRCFFRTLNNYMGLGPHNMQPKDSIWIIPGTRTPFVLREEPKPHTYRLIGECYVHGIMRGEAVSEATWWSKIVLV